MALDAEILDEYRNLYRDLLNLSDGRLPKFQRLWEEIETKIDSFRDLLVKKPRNAGSRQKLLASGKGITQLLAFCSANAILL